MNRFRVFVLLPLFTLLLCIHSNLAFADARAERDTVMKISVGGGLAFSSINMRMEPFEQFKSGWNARAAFRFRRRFGIAGEYTYQFIHNAEPAWENIHTTNLDLNLDYLYFNVGVTNTKFYAITGACFQHWHGVYKGPAAVNQDNLDYKIGDVKAFDWTSLNLGLGFERYYDRFGLFGEFKFRFGKNYPSDTFGIVDAGISLGAKINLVSIGNSGKQEPSSKSRNKRHKIAAKQYHWF